jgi:hypothetical protein
MNDVNSIMKKFEWKSQGGLFGWGISPEADWKIIFVSTIVLVGLVTILNFFIFVKMNRGEIFVIEDNGEAEIATLDMEKIKTTASYYQDKEAEFQKWRNGVNTVIVDPSL